MPTSMEPASTSIPHHHSHALTFAGLDATPTDHTPTSGREEASGNASSATLGATGTGRSTATAAATRYHRLATRPAPHIKCNKRIKGQQIFERAGTGRPAMRVSKVLIEARRVVATVPSPRFHRGGFPQSSPLHDSIRAPQGGRRNASGGTRKYREGPRRVPRDALHRRCQAESRRVVACILGDALRLTDSPRHKLTSGRSGAPAAKASPHTTTSFRNEQVEPTA